MKFLIISHVVHKIKDDKIYGYAPYIREMNLWLKYVDEVEVVAPFVNEELTNIDLAYKHKALKLTQISSLAFLSLKQIFFSVLKLPVIFIVIFKACKKANHIHLRCPGNIGLLGCLVQVLFPKKVKTAKYAGNWDPSSTQPLSYRLQKKLLSNTFLTRNCKVLVYGKWKNQSKNIIPFFTASYRKSEIETIPNKNLNGIIKLIFVGAFSKGKQPLLSVKVAENLLKKGYNIYLDMYGEGELFNEVKTYVVQNSLEKNIILHKNQPKNVVKKAYQKSHFLIFISKSEGWPKVVAEAMFWQCLPISTKVSCVPYMLDYGNRGGLVGNNLEMILDKLEYYINTPQVYSKQVLEAKKWSQQFTLERFESEIKQFL